MISSSLTESNPQNSSLNIKHKPIFRIVKVFKPISKLKYYIDKEEIENAKIKITEILNSVTADIQNIKIDKKASDRKLKTESKYFDLDLFFSLEEAPNLGEEKFSSSILAFRDLNNDEVYFNNYSENSPIDEIKSYNFTSPYSLISPNLVNENFPSNDQISTNFQTNYIYELTQQNTNKNVSELNNNNTRITKMRTKRQSYLKFDVNYKRHCLQLIKSGVSVEEISKDFCVPFKSLKRWLEVGATRLKGSGRKTKDIQMEKHLIHWYKEETTLGNKITPKAFKQKAFQFRSPDKKFHFIASNGWLEKLKKKYNLKLVRSVNKDSIINSN